MVAECMAKLKKKGGWKKIEKYNSELNKNWKDNLSARENKHKREKMLHKQVADVKFMISV